MNDDRMDEIIRGAARDYNVPGPVPREEVWEAVARRRQAARGEGRGTSGRPKREWIWRGIGIAAVLVIGIGIGRLLEQNAGRSPGASRSGLASNTPAVTPSIVSTPDAAGNDTAASSESPRLLGGGVPDVASSEASPSNAQPPASASGRDGARRDDVPSEGLAFRLAVLQHLAGTEAMIVSFRTAARSGDVDAQLTAWSRNLLQTTRLLRASAAASGDATLKRLLDDLELVLLQIAQYTSASPRRAEELELIDQAIEKRGVMTKLRTTSAPRWAAGT